MIKVLIVDDSDTSRQLMQSILDSSENLQVVAEAKNGIEAIEMVKHATPDAIVMDINMPHMDGYETTQAILRDHAIPIIICSAQWRSPDTIQTFKAMDVGAVTAIPKPSGPGHPDFTKHAKEFVRMVTIMSEVRVVRRRYLTTTHKPGLHTAHWEAITNAAIPQQPPPIPCCEKNKIKKCRIVAIGASTGGPPAIKELLCALQINFPVPIVIVQHICDGFLEGMVEWLQMQTHLPISIVRHHEHLRAGHIYFSPNNYHIGVKDGVVVLDKNRPKELGLRPSISHLFHTLAKHYGEHAIGILLTGMGNDGAKELNKMEKKGALTFIQDKASSVIFGMPGAMIVNVVVRYFFKYSDLYL